MSAPRFEMIVNPTSGKGRGALAGEVAAERLRQLGAVVTVRSGNSAADTLRLTEEAIAERPDAIVVVGGDGTLSAVLDTLVSNNIPLALVPAGTGNDLARELGLPFGGPEQAAEAAALALHATPISIDVCEAVCPDGRAKFLTVLAVGFDSRVGDRTNRLRWPKGAARYYLALIIELVRLRPLDFAISIDGSPAVSRPGILAAVGNTRSYGGGMQMCPGADPTDELLDLTHVGPISRLRLLRLFPLLLRAKHLTRPEVFSTRASTVEISAPDLLVDADGERIGTESVRVTVIPGALRVFAPQR